MILILFLCTGTLTTCAFAFPWCDLRGWLSIKYQAADRSYIHTYRIRQLRKGQRGISEGTCSFLIIIFFIFFFFTTSRPGRSYQGESECRIHRAKEELLKSRGGDGRPGLPSLVSLMVSVDVKQRERRKKSDTQRRSTDLKKMRGPYCFWESDEFFSTKASQLSRIICLALSEISGMTWSDSECAFGAVFVELLWHPMSS